MLKKVSICLLTSLISTGYTTSPTALHHHTLAALSNFQIKSQSLNQMTKTASSPKMMMRMMAVSPRAESLKTEKKLDDALEQLSFSQAKQKGLARYQQYYKNIPVIGGQVIIAANHDVNGKVYEALSLNTKPALSKNDVLTLVKKQFPELAKAATTNIELQIRIQPHTKQPRLVYQLMSTIKQDRQITSQPILILDANNGILIKRWNNLKNFKDIGPGGNIKSGEYWYGKSGLPYLQVKKDNEMCTMENEHVRLVNLQSHWDWYSEVLQPFTYPCRHNVEDNTNGAFSPINDAYMFGSIIVDMYQKWYGMHALQYSNGLKMQLVMRVHFGDHFDNAFWDGHTMSFGDGDSFYPLVSLDVASHEVSHGFTEQHANLEYHDQSGAINEAFSDMAGITANAYLLESQPLLHQQVYLNEGDVNWQIGETITKTNGALRYMDKPSQDGNSADCYDKNLALNNGEQCEISYNDVVNAAQSQYQDEEKQQSYIVHSASGIFNRTFYLMAQSYGIKNAFQIMVHANAQYWTPTTNFQSAACDLIQATKDLAYEEAPMQRALSAAGISTNTCH